MTELKGFGELHPQTAAHRSVSKAQLSSRRLRQDDLLLEKSGGGPNTPVGRVGLVPHLSEESVCSNFMQLMRPRADVADPRFLHLYLNHLHAMGATIPLQTASTNIRNIKVSDYAKLAVPVPEISEQRQIVAILEEHLSDLEDAERALDRAARRLAGLREQRVLFALTGGDAIHRRSPAIDPAGTHDGHLPSLPIGWEWMRLGDVAEVVGGVTKDTKKQSDPALPEVPYLRVANVQRGRLDLRSIATIRVPEVKALALALHPGDVLLNEGGDRDKLARGWVWQGQIDGCIHQNHVFRARITERRLDPYFLSLTTNSLGAPWAERNGKQSVNLASISLSMIKKMPVIVPPNGVAVRVVQKIREERESFDRLQRSIDEAVARSSRLRRALLAAAFSGRLTGHGSDRDVIEELAEEESA